MSSLSVIQLIRKLVAAFTLFALLILCTLSSCRKSVVPINKPDDYNPYTFSEIFDAFWLGMRDNYLYWDIDKSETNWDSVYTKYKPLFEKLNTQNFDDVLTAIDYIKAMTFRLTDGHLTISFNDNRLAGFSLNPSRQRKILKDFSHNVSLKQQLFSNSDKYLDKPFCRITGELNAVTGTIKDSIAYLFFDNFDLKRAYSDAANDSLRTLLNNFFLKLKSEKTKRVIIDLRGNSGGDVNDLDFLVGSMISEPFIFGKLKYKSGPGQLNYMPHIEASVMPQPHSFKFNGRLRILIDGLSRSMAEVTTMALRVRPQSLVIGDTTWGSTGMIPSAYDAQLFNGGPFIAAKFINVYTPAAALTYINGRSYEGIGFPPDIRIINSSVDNDDQLEAAIRN